MYVWNVQRRQIHRDRKEITSWQELGGGSETDYLNAFGVSFGAEMFWAQLGVMAA